jgi:hypothetical protein
MDFLGLKEVKITSLIAELFEKITRANLLHTTMKRVVTTWSADIELYADVITLNDPAITQLFDH